MKARWVVGLHSCKEVLKVRPHAVTEIILKSGFRDHKLIQLLEKLAHKNNIPLSRSLERLNKLYVNHQGLGLKVFETVEWKEEVLNQKKSTLLFLDGITDPQNLGAILRTSWMLGGVEGIFIPKNETSSYTPFLSKTACGACEHIPLISCNLAQKIKELKEKGYWVYGLSPTTKDLLPQISFHEKKILVIGSEHKGLKVQILKSCDHLIRIPQIDSLGSYNASVATAISLYETWRQNTFD